MNTETIAVALAAGLGPALVGLVPVYLKMRADRRKEILDAEEKRLKVIADDKKLQSEITDMTRRASEETIRQLSARVDALENDRDELERKLDDEREKRRKAEANLAAAEINIAKLQGKVEKLEKRDTGELRK